MDRWVPQGLVEFLWPAFLSEVIDVHAIDAVMLFGDCRAYHRIAHEIAKERRLEVGVFEEGYIRPDCITLERDGVNGNSTLPDNPIFYLNKVPSGRSIPSRGQYVLACRAVGLPLLPCSANTVAGVFPLPPPLPIEPS